MRLATLGILTKIWNFNTQVNRRWWGWALAAPIAFAECQVPKACLLRELCKPSASLLAIRSTVCIRKAIIRRAEYVCSGVYVSFCKKC